MENVRQFPAKLDGTRVVTGTIRLSYAHLHTPVKISEDAEVAKYSASIIVSKDDKGTLKALKAAVDAAIEAGVPTKWKGKKPTNLKLPLRDGDVERPDDEAYANSYFFNASSINAPQLVDLRGNKNLSTDEVYSGCYGRVSVNMYPFSARGNNGVAAGLGNFQLVADGEPLGGGATSAEQDFDFEEEDFLG